MKVKIIIGLLFGTIFTGLSLANTAQNVKNSLDSIDSLSNGATNQAIAQISPSVKSVTLNNFNKAESQIQPKKLIRPHYVKRKYQPTLTKPTLSTLISNTFDFQYIGDIGGALWAIKEYDPKLSVLDSLGNKSQINVSVDLNNVSIQDVIDVLNQQANGKAKIVFDPIADSIRIYYNSKVDYGTDAIEEARKWQEGGNVRPVLGKDGTVLFAYGEGQAQVVCQPLQLCDISFEPGEYMTSEPIIGDDLRWVPYDAVSKENGKTIQHLIFKPTEAGLNTSLVVPTNKRTYSIKLRSSNFGYVSKVSFFYRKDFEITKDLKSQNQHNDEATKGIKLNQTVSLENIDFNYEIKGDSGIKWRPVRAFSDGSHTYVQMPSDLHSTDAPTFNILGPDGKTSELVNYDLKNNVYIVDKIFSKAEMVMGNSDSTIERIEIIHTEPKKSWW